MEDYSRVAQTYGAIFIGALVATYLSGALALQCLLYMKLFPQDLLRVKVVVGVIWVLDQSHNITIYASLWRYMIVGFGNYSEMELIPVPLALSVLLTGIVTSIVHCFFTYRIHRLSGRDWRVTSIITTLAVCRLCAATVTSAEMIRLPNLNIFMVSLRWLFTVGLAFSCVEDVLIAGFLIYSIYSLQDSSHGRTSSRLDRVVSSVIRYTLETNSLTAAWTIVTMVCWQAMPDNLIFQGAHFLLCKLYANSLLATLNARKALENQQRWGPSMSISLPQFATNRRSQGEATKILVAQTVDQTVEYSSQSNEELPPPPPAQPRKGKVQFINAL